MLSWLRSVWTWLVMAFGVVAGWLWWRREKELEDAQDRAVLVEAAAELERLTKERKRAAGRAGKLAGELDKLDRRVAAQRRTVANAANISEDLSDEELAQELRRILGGRH